MKHLMSAAGVRDAAIESVRTLGSILRRRFFWLLVAAGIGYSFGYQDAYRGPESLGWKVGDLVDRLTPASMSEARQRNAEAIRQRAQSGAEIAP